ncbi:MAG: capsule biosynthesis protein [Cyanobacteria bacterium TGS_CYA1]|nr:capsule biosynthesis protein [Cyanobacteria bacterium TGS_CYA1]
MVKALIERIFKSFFTSSKKPIVAVSENVSDEDWLSDGYSWIPEWKSIIGADWDEWERRREEARGGPKVLIATTVGGNSMLTPLETLYAVGLTLRGAEVHFLLCDKVLPACQNAYGTDLASQKNFLADGAGKDMCNWCFDCGSRSIVPLGLPTHKVSDFLSEANVANADLLSSKANAADINSYKYQDIELGESVMSGALRFFGRGDFDGEIYSTEVLKRFLKGGILCVDALNKLYEEFEFEHTLVNQGFYVPQGIAVEVAKRRGNHLICWDVCYRNNCITMSHSDTYYRSLVDDSIELWNKSLWTEKLENEITNYLTSRWSGKYDWMKFNEAGANSNPDELMQEIGINPSIPVIGLLTNVVWDAQVYYPGNSFPNMLDWLLKTVRFFAARVDLQLLIRVHPAELKSWQKSRQFVEEEIKKEFPILPKNIFIIPPQSTINTYKAMMACDSVLIYATTAGLELACMGIPTIIAGEAWMRGKSIGIDITSQEQYFKILDSLPLKERLDSAQISKAKKYAYHFYLRKMIELGMLEPMPYENCPYRIPKIGISGFDAGSDLGLDIICNGILNNSSFVFPAETRSENLS